MAKIVFDGQTYAGSEDCLACFGETGEQVSRPRRCCFGVWHSACLLELDVLRLVGLRNSRPGWLWPKHSWNRETKVQTLQMARRSGVSRS